METHRHVCPRNCYSTCSIMSKTRGGVLVSIEGDPSHEYTRGKLCPKAMDDVRKVYSPQRIRYPMRQKTRYSGYWERISWEEALESIAQTILGLKQEYGTTLPIALNKYSGNFGALHNAMEGLFTGLGPTTRATGSPCWSAGVDAQMYDFGTFFCSDPLDMEKASLIWLWGVNPAWTAIHQMPIIFKAMEQGAQVVCFDTHLTATAARCHQFVSVRPGTDGMLALALAKIILEEKLFDPNLEDYTYGHQEFFAYLHEEIHLETAAAMTGVSLETMHELAVSYGCTHPACIWAGFGLQRYTNGGQTMRAIDALAALAGHIGEEGGGVQYGQFETWRFAGLLQNSDSCSTGLSTFNLKSSSSSNDKGIASSDRLLNINRFPREALDCNNPPVKMLWLAGRNPFSQDADLNVWHQLVKQLDLIVINDLFLSRSSEAADLFLPVTTHYEHWDLNSSYWHYWVGVNEPAIEPVGETRSDLKIAWSISEVLNRLEPESCHFPVRGSEKESLLQEIGPEMQKILGINEPEDLLKHPYRAVFPRTSWAGRRFSTPSGKFEFYSKSALQNGLPALPVFKPPLAPTVDTPLRLITPHHQSGINSQVTSETEKDDYCLHLAPELAARYGLKDSDRAELFNDNGSLIVKVQTEESLEKNLLVIYQTQKGASVPPLNKLLTSHLTDMGRSATGAPGLALNETFVNLRKLRG